MKKTFYILLVFFCICGQTRSQQSDTGNDHTLHVENLRCEYLAEPLGIDIVKPRLSWILKSDKRGQGQTAYRILVASSPELLAKDKADLWNSGKVISDHSIQIEYNGNTLESRQRCYWKVMVWDKDGRPSKWSKPSFWSMGLFRESDWNVDWITFRDSLKPDPVSPAYGYLSWRADSANSEKWVGLDLGREYTLDAVQLCPAGGKRNDETPGFYTYGWSPKNDGFLFPVRYRIEVARKADFSDSHTVVDQTCSDVSNPGLNPQLYRFNSIQARYVRLTVTRLAARDESNFSFALAEMMVLSGSENVAEYAEVKALDAVRTGGWSEAGLVDGHIKSRYGTLDVSIKPAVMVRKEFNLDAPVKKAVVSVTGLGLYELHVNGQRVGDQVLAPEWTRYSKKIQYQTYDVTSLLVRGLNAVGAQIAGGWWTGPLALEGPLKDPEFCLRMRMDVEMEDGTTKLIATDSSWKATDDGPIRRAGIYYGEIYDGTMEMAGWDKPGYASTGWRPVQVLVHPEDAGNAMLVSQCNEPIRVIREITPMKMTEPKPGVFVFDMGQNMVGWCRLRLNAPAGEKIILRHGEMLQQDGTIYTDNLRGAAQINEYIWRGGEASLEPHFTYHGFRYVELTGFSGTPGKDAILGRVIHSDASDAGKFECSVELINKIMHCVEWVQRGNMHSATTDCPQRTERFGWLGDMQAFAQTSMFNMDMAAFLTKWISDIRDSQLEDGRFPNLAPHPSDLDWLKWYNAEYGPAWSDAGIIIPWLVYQNYGDIRILQQQYEPATRWISFIHNNNPDLIWRNNRGGDYGDWLNGSMTGLKEYPRGTSAVPKDLFATAFFAHSTELLSKMASILGRKKDAARYANLFENIKTAFNKEFVTVDGRVKGETQAGYALALNFNLLHDSLHTRATGYLLESIRKYKDHFSTGIRTTHRMMLELSRNGHHDEAWRLINLRTAPSWGHMVDMGATTIWERWDGFSEDDTFQSPNMNSFNHMAFGSVGEWVWRNVAGINPDEEHPGYKNFLIQPRPVDGLSWVNAKYECIHGTIISEWKQQSNLFSLNISVPANTTATLYLPAKDPADVLESGQPVMRAPGVRFLRIEENCAVFRIVSGNYSFLTTKR